MNSNKAVKYFGVGIILFFSISCVEDTLLESLNYDINNSAELLQYMESRGDFVNSLDAPGLVLAEEVNAHLSEYLVIDIRSHEEYLNGHIPGALNISSSNLITYLLGITPASYMKIVLVSISGQAASYYVCLLRIYGYNNVYALHYGMASWHMDFADIWLQGAKTTNVLDNFVNIDYKKNPISELPLLEFDASLVTIEDKLKSRVNFLFNIEFTDNDCLNVSTELTMTLDELYSNYRDVDSSFPGYYPVCIGNDDIYFDHAIGRLEEDGHPPRTVLIKAVAPHFEMRSNKYLQTLPKDKAIVVYDYDGHLSACFTAYLRVLGYNVKSLLFGYNTLYHDRMLRYPVLAQKAFTQASIQNFTYVRGE